MRKPGQQASTCEPSTGTRQGNPAEPQPKKGKTMVEILQAIVSYLLTGDRWATR